MKQAKPNTPQYNESKEQVLRGCKSITAILLCILFFLIGFVGGYEHTRKKFGNPQTLTILSTDTVTVRDTVTINKPYPKYITQLEEHVDTLIVANTDTIRMEIPLTLITYQDSTYKATVKGYRSTLESIEIYPMTKYITTTVKEPQKRNKPHLGGTLGVGFGYGTIHRQCDVFVGGTIGLTF